MDLEAANHKRTQWTKHLRHLCADAQAQLPLDQSVAQRAEYLASFRDEFGAKGTRPLLLIARLLGTTPPPIESPDPDELLWLELFSDAQTTLRVAGVDSGLCDNEELAIEHRTLVELSGLHALTNLASRPEPRIPWNTVRELVSWHTQELQPDNGVNRPWGIHAFIECSVIENNIDAEMHAQTLVHNCCVTLGKPDLVSGLILLDAAIWLERQS